MIHFAAELLNTLAIHWQNTPNKTYRSSNRSANRTNRFKRDLEISKKTIKIFENIRERGRKTHVTGTCVFPLLQFTLNWGACGRAHNYRIELRAHGEHTERNEAVSAERRESERQMIYQPRTLNSAWLRSGYGREIHRRIQCPESGVSSVRLVYSK